MVTHLPLAAIAIVIAWSIQLTPTTAFAQWECAPQNITIEPLDPIFCNGQQNGLILTPNSWNFSFPPTYNGNYSAAWQMSSDGTNWAEAPGTASGSPYYPPSNLPGPRWFRAQLNCSDGSSYFTDPYEVFPLIEGFMVGDQSLCPDGSTEFSFGFPFHDVNSLPITSFNWRFDFDWVLIGGPSSLTVTQPGNWAGQVVVENTLGSCYIPIQAVDLEACDLCPTATPLACNSTATGNTTNGPYQLLGSPSCGSASAGNAHAVWYSLTPDASGSVTVSVCAGTAFDAFMRVYSGDCGSLTCIGSCGSSSCAGTNSLCTTMRSVTFNGVAGTTYRILLAGYFHGEMGNYTIAATCPVAVCSGTPVGGAAVSSANEVYCSSQTFALSLNGASNLPFQTYQWQSSPTGSGGWTNIAGATSATLSTTQSATTHYRCRITCGGNTVSSASVEVDQGSLTITATPNSYYCAGSGSIGLTASIPGAASYTWHNNIGSVVGGNSQTLTVGSTTIPSTGAGAYTVTVVIGGCTIPSDLFIVEEFPAPEPLIQGPANNCPGQSASLSGPPGYVGYVWMTVTGPNSYDVIPNSNAPTYGATVAGSYVLEVTDQNGCTGLSNVVSVAFSQAFNVSISGSQVVGGTITANVSPLVNYTYQWHLNGNAINGATEPSLVTTGGGSYTVVVTDQNECTATSSPHVVDWCAPGTLITVNATASPTPFCPGQPVTLSLQAPPIPNTAYEWQISTDGGQTFTDIPNGDQHTIIISPTVNAIYQCNYFCGSQSATSNSIAVNMMDAPTISISGPACIGATLTANPSNGQSYQWFHSVTPLSGNSSSITAPDAGLYYVIVNINGCELTSGFATINQPPTVAVQPSVANLCPGDGVVFFGPADMSQYTWTAIGSTLGTTNPLVKNYADFPSSSGVTYTGVTLTVVDDNGCSGSGQAGVNTLPGANPVIVENAGVLSLTESYANYQWFRNNIALTGANGPTYPLDASGSYHVVVTNSYGCTGTSAPFTHVSVSENRAVLQFELRNHLSGGELLLLFHNSEGLVPFIRLVDLTGRQLMNTSLPAFQGDNLQIMDISSLSKGIYLCELTIGNARGVRRAVRE